MSVSVNVSIRTRFLVGSAICRFDSPISNVHSVIVIVIGGGVLDISLGLTEIMAYIHGIGT